ncbi:MAG: NAD-dependent deacylase [Oligoflexia bacterium]|nr:NAD-dependent deacylase [Oligoflexia bacterium]
MGANIFVLCGAGISQESGISTFRDQSGLWENHSIEDVASPEGFMRNPELVHQFYNLRRRQLKSVIPNKAHYALANFQKIFSGKFLLVTQNVDDLHERAGSCNVLHMHGQLRQALCTSCKFQIYYEEDLSLSTECEKYKKKGSMRPDIVWFGEVPYFLDECDEFLQTTDLFISIGTSGSVYPAAGFIQMLNPKARSIELNLCRTEISSFFSETRFGKASEIVPKTLNEVIEGYK